jgi:hypothetical protein
MLLVKEYSLTCGCRKEERELSDLLNSLGVLDYPVATATGGARPPAGEVVL